MTGTTYQFTSIILTLFNGGARRRTAKTKSVWWKYTNIGGMRLLTGVQIYACLQYPILIPEAI